MCTAASQSNIPDFLKDMSGTSVTSANGPRAGVERKIGDRVPVTAETIPMGDGLAQLGRQAIIDRRNQVERAVLKNGG